MNFAWTPHRFAGGALALDVANSIILRDHPSRRTDRFAVPEQLAEFSGAARRLCADKADLSQMEPLPAGDAARFLDLREAIDAHFRHATLRGESDPLLLAGLLEGIAGVLRAAPAGRLRLDSATAWSALRLVSDAPGDRIKICGNCGWLFLDRSRNRSRVWCDMAVCGNRAKARRYYHRSIGEDAP